MTTSYSSKLTNEVWLKIRAGFKGLWIRTHEPFETMEIIKKLASEKRLGFHTWDCVLGLHDPDDVSQPEQKPTAMAGSLPAGLMTFIQNNVINSEMIGDPEDDNVTELLVIKNAHLVTGAPQSIQAVQNAIQELRGRGAQVICLALPSAQLPADLERHLTILDHELPGDDELWDIAQISVASYHDSFLGNHKGDLPPEVQAAIDSSTLPETGTPEATKIIEPARGFTRSEFADAACESLISHKAIVPGEMWHMKDQLLKRKGLLELHRSKVGFESLGGLDIIKRDTLEIFQSPHFGENGLLPRGMILLGPGGTGKSQFAKCLGKELGRPVLIFEIGKLFGSLVGQTESRTREVLALADAMAPCILFVDEIDRALAGTAGGSGGDSGVSSRMMGTLMTWLNDHTSDVYFVGTSNDVSGLPDAFLRAQRFDGVYFFDFPGPEAQRTIWDWYLKQYNLPADSELPDHDQWTGAEIMSCCRLAKLRNRPLVEVAKSITPQAKVNEHDLSKLRSWASGKCQSADYEGPYSGPQAKSKAKTSRRKSSAPTSRRMQVNE